jgi:hypothetical protein
MGRPSDRDCVGVTVALGVLLCYGFGTGMWQVYESTPLADIAVNGHQSSISSLAAVRVKDFEV